MERDSVNEWCGWGKPASMCAWKSEERLVKLQQKNVCFQMIWVPEENQFTFAHNTYLNRCCASFHAPCVFRNTINCAIYILKRNRLLWVPANSRTSPWGQCCPWVCVGFLFSLSFTSMIDDQRFFSAFRSQIKYYLVEWSKFRVFSFDSFN